MSDEEIDSADVEDEFAVGLEREFSLLLRRARVRSRLLAAEAGVDIDADAYGLLVQVAQSDKPRVTDIAKVLGVGKPTVSRQIKDLEERGLIERTPDSRDSRSFRLGLSEDGAVLLDRVRTNRRKVFGRVFGGWSPEERETFIRLLARANASPHISLKTQDPEAEGLIISSEDRERNSATGSAESTL